MIFIFLYLDAKYENISSNTNHSSTVVKSIPISSSITIASYGVATNELTMPIYSR